MEIVTNPTGERLVITLEEVLQRRHAPARSRPGLTKDGVEAHLQELLAAAPHVLGDGLVLVRREYPTDIGPVDLLCRDADGVRRGRRGEASGGDGRRRAAGPLRRAPRPRQHAAAGPGRVRGPGRASRRPASSPRPAGSRWVEVDYDELRGLRADELRLF